ncbi:UPF0481 protein, partial [Mucuna pruriens]
MSENANLEERLKQLQNAKEKREYSGPKIQRVAHHLRERKHFGKHYSPRLMSLGPIHHGDSKLEVGEKYKQMWAATYMETTGQSPQTLYDRVAGDIQKLKALFGEDIFSSNDRFSKYEMQGFRNVEEMICWMLFVDGCALLHILENAKLHVAHIMNVKVDQLVLVMQDVLLLENQLPFMLLKLLWRDTIDDRELIQTMKGFLKCHHWATRNEHKINIKDYPPPAHLLDLQRTIILRRSGPPLQDPKPNANHMGLKQNFILIKMIMNKKYIFVPIYVTSLVYRNIKELRAAGIALKSSKTRRPTDMCFSYGWFSSELTLPEIVVDDTTATTLLNLIAYEMCPDFENDYGICSFVSFLDSLIDHADDVKALRSKEILLNSLGSDEEVANLFNTISTDLVPDMGKYAHLRAQIEKHYKNKLRTWLALGCNTYFSNPWAIIAFLAAVFGLALTFIQTCYAIHPAK